MRLAWIGALWLLAWAGATPVNAAPAPPTQILQLYSYELKDRAQFELGYRRHLAWHAAHDDKLVWYGWMVDSGRRKGLFVDGTAGASYAAIDMRPDLAGDGADATLNFVSFVHAENVETWELWPVPSTATPLEDRAPTALIDVFVLHAAPEAAMRFEHLLTRLAADRRGSPLSLTWYKAVRGGSLPAYMLVLSRNDWADIERAGGAFSILLARAYGAAPEKIEKLLGAISHIEVESWSYQPRLSLIPGKPLAVEP